MENRENENIQDDMILQNNESALVISDQKEALSALAMDDEFVNNLISQTTLKAMQQLFYNRGVILSEEEIDDFIEMVKASVTNTELPDEFFDNAAAGASVLNNAGTYQLVSSVVKMVNNDSNAYWKSVLWV
jgi:hypothetical protein